ncbi:hypothetical protein IGI39_003318 [Enterococcus sp. AZ135]|uniref:hypothetical protein n=1 Tax=unclassified Enterococcus TaxID=2608891 RepID=UPI003F29C717
MIEFVLSKEQKEDIRSEISVLINQTVEKNASVKYLGREFLRIGETADYLGVTPATVNKFFRLGLTVSVIDGTKLVSKTNIKTFVESFEQ